MAVPASARAARTPQPPRSKRRRLLIGAVVLASALGSGAYLKYRHRDQATLVTVEPATVRTLTQYVTATGKIQPEVEVKIAPEVSGEIVELPYREGAQVKKGDLLVALRADNYRYQVDQREADLAAARAAAVQSHAQLLKAQSEFRRADDLFQKQLLSASAHIAAKTDVDVAQANYDSALAQIRRAEGLLKQAQDQLEKTTIYSPMDGTVSLLKTEVGERIAATGQFNAAEVLRVADLANMEVRVEVNENDVVHVKVGDRAKISIDAFPQEPFTGEVTEIASTATTLGENTQEQVTNFEVKIRIDRRDQLLKPGMSAVADIATKTATDVVTVPIQSVTVRSREGAKTIEELANDREKLAEQKKGEGAATVVNLRETREKERADRDALRRVVFVVDQGKVKQVPVETGIADTTHMEIISGVTAGQQVVSGSFATITRILKDGMAVQIEEPKAAKKN